MSCDTQDRMPQYENPVYQQDVASVPRPRSDYFPQDEKSALIMDSNSDDDLKIQPHSSSFFQRHFKKLIALAFCLLIFVIVVAVAVPQGIKALMGKYLRGAEMEVYEMEVLNIVNGTAYVRINGSMSVDAPFDVKGSTEEAFINLMIPDPEDRSIMALIGVVYLPPMSVEGTTILLNINTTLTLMSDRLFHEFINDILYNATVTAYMEGEVTITAEIPVYGGITARETLLAPVTIEGMNGLDFELLRMDLYESTNDTVSLWFELNIKNPSQFYSSYPLPLYFVNIRLYFNDTFLGFLEPQDLFIGKGDSFNVAIGTLVRTPVNEEAIGIFLSDYIMGFDVPIVVDGTAKVDVGLEKNPDYPCKVVVDWVMPGIEADLITDLFSDLSDVKPFPLPIKLIAVALLVNPLDFDIELRFVEFDGYVGDPCNRTVSKILETYPEPLLVPSKVPLCVPLTMSVSLGDLDCLVAGAGSETGLILYAQNGRMEIKLDQFIIQVEFEYGPLYAVEGPCLLPTQPAPTTMSLLPS